MGLLKGFVMGFKGAEGLIYNIEEAYRIGFKGKKKSGATTEEAHSVGLATAYSNFMRLHGRLLTGYTYGGFPEFELLPFLYTDRNTAKKAFAHYLASKVYEDNSAIDSNIVTTVIAEGITNAATSLGWSKKDLTRKLELGIGWAAILLEAGFEVAELDIPEESAESIRRDINNFFSEASRHYWEGVDHCEDSDTDFFTANTNGLVSVFRHVFVNYREFLADQATLSEIDPETVSDLYHEILPFLYMGEFEDHEEVDDVVTHYLAWLVYGDHEDIDLEYVKEMVEEGFEAAKSDAKKELIDAALEKSPAWSLFLTFDEGRST